MKLKFLVPSLIVFSLSSCVFKYEEYKLVKYINFDGTTEDNTKYWCSNGYSNGGMFLSYWNKNNVSLNEGIANLSLYDDSSKGKNYGSEIKSSQGFLYGYYGARMKVFKKVGTIQSVFTYNGGEYAHDEIDIEFFGKDTTIVQFNYYHNGVGGHEHIYHLGFDASEEFHDYGFKWMENKIIWFVDNKSVYSVNASLPQWGFLFANVWAANPNNATAKKWAGEYVSDTETYVTQYDYLSYSPL